MNIALALKTNSSLFDIAYTFVANRTEFVEMSI